MDELCITMIPTLLPDGGVRLFDSLVDTTRLVFDEPQRLGGMVQLTLRPRR